MFLGSFWQITGMHLGITQLANSSQYSPPRVANTNGLVAIDVVKTACKQSSASALSSPNSHLKKQAECMGTISSLANYHPPLSSVCMSLLYHKDSVLAAYSWQKAFCCSRHRACFVSTRIMSMISIISCSKNFSSCARCPCKQIAQNCHMALRSGMIPAGSIGWHHMLSQDGPCLWLDNIKTQRMKGTALAFSSPSWTSHVCISAHFLGTLHDGLLYPFLLRRLVDPCLTSLSLSYRDRCIDGHSRMFSCGGWWSTV